jgi:hypothetical protein
MVGRKARRMGRTDESMMDVV